MKKLSLFIFLSFVFYFGTATAQRYLSYSKTNKGVVIHTENGMMSLLPLNDNAVRVKFNIGKSDTLPELIYLNNYKVSDFNIVESKDKIELSLKHITLQIDKKDSKITYYNNRGKKVLEEEPSGRSIGVSSVQGMKTYSVEQKFYSPSDEYLFGLGQFQDGNLNIRGLSRRLTQVNTQISVPFLLSNKGYGILWNNYGLTEFNPIDNKVALNKGNIVGNAEIVNVTTTEGGKNERRVNNEYVADIEVNESGYYSLLLDVGTSMAHKHQLSIDGKPVFDVKNLWLPPTMSAIAYMEKGAHKVTADLSNGDKPIFYFKKVDDETAFRSPVAGCLDYTVFVGKPEDVIASYRKVTGEAPMMPDWALGYIHCRERFHSQDEILNTAKKFRNDSIPLDVIVQDWQYWGKYGWNAMRFDEDNYPDPKQMTSQLHKMNIKFMVSVWSKIDTKSEVGKLAEDNGFFIPQTSWIDFFNPKACEFYWTNFSKRLLPLDIDAWWQDATEPENDDLVGRRINNGKMAGEVMRNVYPLLVNKTVYEGCRKDEPNRRTMILTRCGFSGIQRYSVANWSGDIGNDWDALKRQITGGLSLMASGLPWWTYDAGGFFRPNNQYADKSYHERFLRWFQVSTFLPLQRVHGYMTNTEFWNYGDEVTRIARTSINLRYRLLPYIYTENAAISFKGSTLMRPFVMDYSDDTKALEQKYEFMFGPSLLIAPVLEENAQKCSVYLPKNNGGWYNFWTGKKTEGESTIKEDVTLEHIPVYVKAGTILPLGKAVQYADEDKDKQLEIRIYKGNNADYTLYEDEGDNYNYEKGLYTKINIKWEDASNKLIIGQRIGKYRGMPEKRIFRIVLVGQSIGLGVNSYCTKEITYIGKKTVVSL